MARRDLIGIIEAAYRTDLDDASWIREVTEAAAPLLDEGEGVAGYLIDTTGSGPPVHSPVVVGERDPWDGDWRRRWWDARVTRMPLRLIADLAGFGSPSYASQSCGAVVRGATVARLARDIPPMPLPDGVRDALVVSGYDANGEGAVLFAFRRFQVVGQPSQAERARWQRISGHLTAATRLRRMRRRDGAWNSDQEPMATDAVRAATKAIDRARTRSLRMDERALDLWPALHAGRFSVVPAHGDEPSYRAIENRPTSASLGMLTSRESTAVTLLCLGRSNKAMAYELGIAPSTVSTLLTSAARKLGVTGAREIISRARATVHASARAGAIAEHASLTESEAVVLALLLAGLSDHDIKGVRRATRSTVTKQVDAVFRKLGVGSRRELLAFASSFAPWKGPSLSATVRTRNTQP